jgi:hypothetical protein
MTSGTTAYLDGVRGTATNDVFVVGRDNCETNGCDTGQTCDTVTHHCQGGGGVTLHVTCDEKQGG